MKSSLINPAWIEMIGNCHAVVSSCAIDRATTTQIVLDEKTVSRTHALIHLQGRSQHVLLDLGSNNGTHLNGMIMGRPDVHSRSGRSRWLRPDCAWSFWL